MVVAESFVMCSPHSTILNPYVFLLEIGCTFAAITFANLSVIILQKRSERAKRFGEVTNETDKKKMRTERYQHFICLCIIRFSF